MELKRIDWIGKRYVFFGLSVILIGTSLFTILTKGFNYGIDFTGGSMVQVTYERQKTLAQVREDLGSSGYPEASPQSFVGEKSSFAIFFKGERQLDAAEIETFLGKLQAADAGNKVIVDRKEFVGPSVGRHLKKQAATAIILAMLGIIIYVAFRFDNPLWGAAGVTAIAHDVIFVAGLFSLLGKEVNLVIVAAFMTIAGYSINDTIVIFDRMREILKMRRGADLYGVINDATNDMMSRTLITNGMVLSVVTVLLLLGGEVIHDFAFAMVCGALIGTYSTIGLATPLVYQWHHSRRSAAAPAPPKDGKPASRRS